MLKEYGEQLSRIIERKRLKEKLEQEQENLLKQLEQSQNAKSAVDRTIEELKL